VAGARHTGRPPGRSIAAATAAAAVLAACAASACDGGSAATHIEIRLEVPSEDAGGALLGDLESLEFSVSDGRDFLTSQLYRIEDGLPTELSLPEVPPGDQILFHLSGLALGAEVAYGQTCRLVVNESEDPISALLYFSRVGSFRSGAEPLEPHRHAGLMFADDQGRAFVTGGSTETLVELFDPREGDFSEAGKAARRTAGAIAVRGDGTAVLAGGVDPEDGTPIGVVEEIVPRSGSADRIRRLGPALQEDAERTGLALAALPDRSVLLTGGRIPTGEISKEVELLELTDDQFRKVAELAQPRTGHTASVGLGGIAYIIGGLSVDTARTAELATGAIELYRPQDRSVQPVAAALTVPRFGHTATVLEDGRILLVGGKAPRTEGCALETGPESCFTAVAEVELFDPFVGEVRLLRDAITGGIYDHTATLVPGGRVLIAGGMDGDGNVRDDAWLFDPDPQVEALIRTRALTHARAGHTATELCDGTVLLVGGTSDGDEPLPSERYSPLADRLP